MKKMFIGDDKVILNLQGLRFIQKVDHTGYSSTMERYYLEWEYKGAKGSVSYESKDDRDKLYAQVKEVLIKAMFP